MLTPDQLAHCSDSIVELYSQLNEAIIRDVARRIAKTSVITETGELQLSALRNLGTLHADLISSISKYNNMGTEELLKIFADASMTAVEYDSRIYRNNGLNPLPLNLSPTAMQILEAGFKKTNGNLLNLTRTSAISTQSNFIRACTMAEMKAESGAFSAEQAIFDAVKELAIEGATVTYPSGHQDKIDVAVRRNVMTGIGQTTGEICLAYAEELGCDLMEITAHIGARPSHAAWQGQIVSISGKPGYLSLEDIGYGTGAGFKGWNCRHDWYPYFEGSTRMNSQADLAALEEKNIEFPDGSMHTYYEAEQYQRGLERKIRESKRILAAEDEWIKNNQNAWADRIWRREFDIQSAKLKNQESALASFCHKTGLNKDATRVQALGFNRSVSQKAVHGSKRELEKYTKYQYNKDGTLRITDDWKGRSGHFKTPKHYKPFAVIETREEKAQGNHIQINRTIYDENGDMSVQIHSSHHNLPKAHPYGENGEHHHHYQWVEGEKDPLRTTDDLTDQERKEHADIL